MGKPSSTELGEKFGRMLVETLDGQTADGIAEHIMSAIAKLSASVYKSAQDPARGDFAKGREQMAMHAIALLVGSDWRTIERILFGENNGS